MEHESIELLSRYLQFNTTNPPGNEAPAAEFFAEIFKKEGIEYKTYEPEPSRISIRAVLPGSGERGPVILLNHMDVVPAESKDWSFDPFGGEIKDGFVQGRGAIDMKSQGIMELMAFLAMKREGVRLRGDLVFLAMADEETLGEHGAKLLIEEYPEDFKADLVINEGGFGLRDILPNKPVLMISTAEKGLRWVKLTRTGPPGHGSTPHLQNALEELTKALNRLLTEESPVTITPIIAEYFRKMGQGWDFLSPYIEDGKTETLVDILNQSGLLAIPQVSAMVRNTISLTGMQAGTNVNVIPGTAKAQLDIRFLPGQEGDSFMKAIKERLGDHQISFDLIGSTEPTESPWGTQDYALIEEVLQEEFPGCIVTPSLLFASSDSRFFRHKGIPTYGICPVLVSLEDINMIHGIDEKISVENMIKGTEVYTKIIRRLCA